MYAGIGRGRGVLSNIQAPFGRGRGVLGLVAGRSEAEKAVNWDICILCQNENDEPLLQPSKCVTDTNAYSYIANNLIEFEKLGSVPVNVSLKKINDGSGVAQTLAKHNAKWHKFCYMKVNTCKLERAKAKYKSISDDLSTQRETRQSCDSTSIRDKASCFFCEGPGTKKGPLHQVAAKIVSKKVSEAAEILMDTKILAKLAEGDLVAQDAAYHKLCMTDYYRRANLKSKVDCTEEDIELSESTALAELVAYIEECRQDTNTTVFKLSEISKLYGDRLKQLEEGLTENKVHSTRLKERLLEAMPNLKCEKSGKEIYLILQEDLADTIVQRYKENEDEEAIHLMRAAQLVRKEIASYSYEFDGTFSEASEKNSVPPKLLQLINFILFGSVINSNSTMTIGVQENMALSMSQLLIYNSFQSSKGLKKLRHYSRKETPLPIFLSIYMHSKTRSREVVDQLHQHGLGISYQRLQDISQGIGQAAMDSYTEQNVVCPVRSKSNILTGGTIDNIDVDYKSTLAQDSFHGTALCLLQFPTDEKPGEDRHIIGNSPIVKPKTKLGPLLPSYSIVPSVSLVNKQPKVPLTIEKVSPTQYEIPTARESEESWLHRVESLIENRDKLDAATFISWAAFHAANKVASTMPLTSIYIMPLFYECAHTPAMMLHGMHAIQVAVEHLNPGQTPFMTGDQPLYALMKQLQWENPEVGEDKMVVMMGGLHIEMTIFKLIGHWIQGSGWSTALSDSGVTTSGRSNHAEKGGDVSQAKYYHQVTAASLYILQKQAYGIYVDNDGVLEFEAWCDMMKEKEPQFLYWSQTLELEVHALIFVRSIREANFLLYTEALALLLPMFFAMDHTNYARWASVHLRDMLLLQNNHPTLYDEFLKGNFTVHKTTRAGSNIAMDQAHEQENKNLKGEGGAVGLYQDEIALQKFCIVGPEFVRICKEFERKHPESNVTKHHDQTDSFQNQFFKNVKCLTEQINMMGNPFLEDTGSLIALDTKQIMPDSVVKEIKSAKQLGYEQFQDFFQSRINDEENKPITDVLKKNKLLLLSGTDPKVATKSSILVQNLKADTKLFSDMYIAAQNRESDMDDFFRHENNSFPPSLSNNGVLRKSNKSDLIECLLKDAEIEEQVQKPDAKIFDGAAMVQMLLPKGCSTFNEYAENIFLPYLRQQSVNCQRVDVVFDVYKQDTLKSQTRLQRGSGIRRKIIGSTPIPTNWAGLLRVDENKTELFSLLAEKAVSLMPPETMILCTIGNEVITSHPNFLDRDITPSTQEEADTRILLHVAHCVKNGFKNILIRTVDTDVVVLSIAYFYLIKPRKMSIAFGTGKNFKHISINNIALRLGENVSRALPIFHAFTGCDTTSCFSGKGKKTAWETWSSFPDITDVFLSLSMMPNDIDFLEVQHLEKFVTLLYQKSSSFASCNEARRDLFTGGRSIENVPPTSDALLQHVKRSVYQAGFIWSQCLVPCPFYPNAELWGWTRMDGKLEPLWTTLPQASKGCRSLIRCGCKVRCSGRCQCSNSNLKCTELCTCKAKCTNS